MEVQKSNNVTSFKKDVPKDLRTQNTQQNGFGLDAEQREELVLLSQANKKARSFFLPFPDLFFQISMYLSAAGPQACIPTSA